MKQPRRGSKKPGKPGGRREAERKAERTSVRKVARQPRVARAMATPHKPAPAHARKPPAGKTAAEKPKRPATATRTVAVGISRKTHSATLGPARTSRGTAKRPARPSTIRIRVVRLAHAHGLPLPAYQTADAAGIDLVAALPEGKPLRLRPGARALVPTGLVLELPSGTEAQVRPRSGLAFKAGVTVLNSPGTIDADYRGEVGVLLVNLGTAPFVVARGERIAQLVVAPVARAALVEVAVARDTARGAGGFGSTGTRTSASSSAQTKTLAERAGRKNAARVGAARAQKSKTMPRRTSQRKRGTRGSRSA